MELNEQLKQRRLDLGLTLEQVGDYVGVGKSTVRKWETGMIRDMKRSQIGKYAEILQISPTMILGLEDNPIEKIYPISLSSSLRIPLLTLAAASCGYGSYVEEDILDYISLPASICKLKKGRKYFSIVAEGDSMTGAGIEDGNILVFEETDVPVENKIGLFCVDDHYSYCKKFKMIDGKPCLISMNENYLPIELGDNFRTLGTLKFIVREV